MLSKFICHWKILKFQKSRIPITSNWPGFSLHAENFLLVIWISLDNLVQTVTCQLKTVKRKPVRSPHYEVSKGGLNENLIFQWSLFRVRRRDCLAQLHHCPRWSDKWAGTGFLNQFEYKSQHPVVDLGHHDSSHVTSLVDMKFETLLSASLLFFLLIIILFTTNVFVKLL